MSVQWIGGAPPVISDDPASPYNKPFAVTKGITGTLAPFVAAMRRMHVEAWLREMTLQQVVEAWWYVRGQKGRGKP